MRIFTLLKLNLLIAFSLFSAIKMMAGDPPAHDPSHVVKEGNTYYTFATGNGIWNFSTTDSTFQSYTAEDLVFSNGTWPDWVSGYVSGFAGTFWAPGIIYMNNKWHLYYSCSTFGSQTSAIGLVNTDSLANRNWEDQGMVVYSVNDSVPYSVNAIDPELFRDQDNKVWMLYGSYWDGIIMTEIDTTTGLPYDRTNVYYVANNSCEASGMMYYESYYYAFFNRGSCCSGITSTYRILMGRSTSPTGPFYDKDSVKTSSGGGSVFLHSDGKFIGPGHFGYNLGILTYHYYDGSNSGTACMGHGTIVTGDDGWPMASYTREKGVDDGTYNIVNKNSGMALHAESGSIAAKTNIEQYTLSTTDAAQQWNVTYLGDGYYKITAEQDSTLCIEIGYNSTSNKGNVRLQEYSGSENQQWFFEYIGTKKYRIVNRNSFLVMEVYNALTTDGANIQQYELNGETCQQWYFTAVDPSNGNNGINTLSAEDITIFPNPTESNFTLTLGAFSLNETVEISIYSIDGKLVDQLQSSSNNLVYNKPLNQGIYLVSIKNSTNKITKKLIIR